MTKPEFDLEAAVRSRYSVRTYDKAPLKKEIKEKLLSYASRLQNPLGPKIRVQLIDVATASKGEKLGTYGIIKGAQSYLAVTVPKDPCASEAVGYDFERLVLYAASLGLGTCWLGGTFNRSAFAAAIEIGENERFPILSPIGYIAEKKRLSERLFRRGLGADNRKPWQELFFRNDFQTPLSREAAGSYGLPLEMLRLAPSAVNRQPWRVLATKEGFHFYEKHSSGSDSGIIDMQRLDVGIAICHFHLAAMEKGLKGQFRRIPPPAEAPKDTEYIVSWILTES